MPALFLKMQQRHPLKTHPNGSPGYRQRFGAIVLAFITNLKNIFVKNINVFTETKPDRLSASITITHTHNRLN